MDNLKKIDIFEQEQNILDHAIKHIDSSQESDGKIGFIEYSNLAKEYGRLLKQLRRVTKISDRMTGVLNTSKLDLLDKVHYDALTGIYNRRFMEESLRRIHKSLVRSGGTLALLMLDVDFFKKYNDTYGHSAGDVCLKCIAQILTTSLLRPDDFAARYGGEEFIVVLPNTDQKGACDIAKRIVENIQAQKIPHEKNEASDVVTISIGVTAARVNVLKVGCDYICKADEALYMSKTNGRNRYTFLPLEVVE